MPFSLVQISRRDTSYSSCPVFWLAPNITSTQRNLNPRFGAWFWIIITVGKRDAHSAHHNTCPGVALSTRSRSIVPLCAKSGILCINKSEICIHLLNPQLAPSYYGKSIAPLHAVVHPIYTSCYDSYAVLPPACCCVLPRSVLRSAYCRVILWSLWSYHQDAFNYTGVWVPWTWASHMTGGSGGQQHDRRTGGLYRQQCCSPDAVQGLWDCALWFGCWRWDVERWLLVARSWGCDWSCSNCPWGLFYVLVHVSGQYTVARLRINEPVQLNTTSSGSSESWSRQLTPCKIFSHGKYNPIRRSIRPTSWTASSFQYLFPCLPFASSWVPFAWHWHCLCLFAGLTE